MKIPWLNFEKWSTAGLETFSWKRFYLFGYKWTPLIFGVKR
jgi:hypothetical protein